MNVGPDLANRVAQANGQHGLAGIFQDVHDLLGRGFEIQALAVGQKVVVGCAADGLRQALPELLLQKADDFADSLKREAFVTQLADDCYFREIFEGIKASMAFSYWNHDATLIPPLQLTWSNAGQLDDIAGCELLLHGQIVLNI